MTCQIYNRQWWDDRHIVPDAKFRGLQLRALGEAEVIPIQIEAMNRSHILRPLVSGPASERAVTRVSASFMATLPALGYQVYAVKPTPNPNRNITVAHAANVMENEYLRVHIAPNGTFTLHDNLNDQTFRNLGYLKDGGDSGDGYNYSAPLQDRVENTLGLNAHISRIADGPITQRYRIEYDWLLPEGLDSFRRKRSDVRVLNKTSVIVSLAEGSRCVEIQVTFDNHARDHRLRMIFPSDVKTDASDASAQFDIVRHPVEVVPVPAEAWLEDAPTTFPQQNWVDVSDGTRGLCVINCGLPEYEVVDTERREIAITLLRAVGYLGAGPEMLSAAAGAGPHIATPGAQIQRILNYSLALLPHRGSWESAEVWREAMRHSNPPRAYTTGMVKNARPFTQGNELAQRSFLKVEGDNIVLSAVKKAEQDNALILRLYNPSNIETQATIRLPFAPSKVELVGLDEQARPEMDSNASVSGDQVRLSLPGGKIVTLRMELP